MATEVRSNAKLEPALQSLLSRLRRKIRSYVWVDGLAAIVLLLAGAFWVSLALDWLIEPPRWLRGLALAGVTCGAAYVAYRTLISRLLVPLADHNMAVVIERRFRQFRDSLLTAVELSEHPDHAAEFHPQMLAGATRQALADARQVDLGQVFNTRPLVRRVSLAFVLVAAIVGLAIVAPAAVRVWARRTILLSSELWPRYTQLSVVGFGDDRRVKIARGSDWDLVVEADAELGRRVPEIVEVRYSTIEGVTGRENMSREGVVAQGAGQKQPYAYAFKSVLAPLEFYVAGGDDREGPYQLEVVDSPTLSSLTLQCKFPEYTGRASRDLAVAGLMQVPQGTEITILAKSNKPLVDVQIDDVAGEAAAQTHRLDIVAEAGKPRDEFTVDLGKLDADKTLLFTLHDSDGIHSREAVRLTLAAVPDEPPQVDVQLRGISTAVTPDAQLPTTGRVSDDYGVSKVWFSYNLEEAPPQQRDFPVEAAGKDQLEISGVMQLADLKLKPKQRLQWSVQAADNCALQGGANVGASQRFVFDVVTPEQLRSMLEARELLLRRRFETIIEELTDTRNLLGGMQLGEQPAESTAAGQPANQAEGERESATQRLSPAVQVERVLQNTERSLHEVEELATSFDDIRLELVNNRIDTEEVKTRLKEGIADPLRRIAAERYPSLLENLAELGKQLGEREQAVATQTESVAQIDAILVEMQGVLDKMLELETFNEALDMLRKIIETQEEVNQETKQQQKKDLRSLIE